MSIPAGLPFKGVSGWFLKECGPQEAPVGSSRRYCSVICEEGQPPTESITTSSLCKANRTSRQQLWVFSVQFSLNPEDTHHNYANGAYKEKENTSRHLSETPYGGLKRFPWRCCSLDITVAGATHYHWMQRSYPAGNNSGRLSVSHPVPSPKWKFTEGIEKGSRATSDPHSWIILEWLSRGPVGWPQGLHTHTFCFYQAQQVPHLQSPLPHCVFIGVIFTICRSRLIFPGVVKWCSEIFSEAEAPANGLSS